MAEGGYDPPEWDPYDDNPDDDNADETTPFFPNAASTPAPEFQTYQKEKDGFPDLPKVPKDLPKLTDDFLTELPSLSSTTLTAQGEIDKEFPNVDKNKIKFMMDRKGRTKVGLIRPKKPYYNLLTTGLTHNFQKKF